MSSPSSDPSTISEQFKARIHFGLHLHLVSIRIASILTKNLMQSITNSKYWWVLEKNNTTQNFGLEALEAVQDLYWWFYSGHQDARAPALSKHPSHPGSRSSSLNLILDAIGYYYYFQVNPSNPVILAMKATCRGVIGLCTFYGMHDVLSCAEVLQGVPKMNNRTKS